MSLETWLLFSGALAQARINWDVDAPVTGASMAIFYASGVVFAVAAGLLLALDLWRIVSGQMPDSELVQISESEELASVDAFGGGCVQLRESALLGRLGVQGGVGEGDELPDNAPVLPGARGEV